MTNDQRTKCPEAHNPLICGIDPGTDCDICLANRWLKIVNALDSDPVRRDRIVLIIQAKLEQQQRERFESEQLDLVLAMLDQMEGGVDEFPN